MNNLLSAARAVVKALSDLQHLVMIGLLIFLYLLSTVDYPAFHSFAEILTVVVAACIFIVAWNTRKYAVNSYLMIIGIGFLFVAVIDVFHLLAYKGMSTFAGYGVDLPTQLWIAGRYIEAFSLLAAMLALARKVDYRKTFIGMMLATGFLLASIFYWDIFPACYVEGVGLTPFKIYSEYAIAGIVFVSMLLLAFHRHWFRSRVFRLIGLALALSIASGLMFTLYSDVYDIYNFAGHGFRLIAFYMLFLAIVQTGLKAPYDLVFRSLKKSEEDLSKTNEQLVRDIAERKKAENALQDAKAQAELYVDLMSHDINNMNQIGMASLELALDNDSLDPETRDLLKKSLGAFTGSSKLIGNVKRLQMARDETLKYSLIDLDQVLGEVARQHHDDKNKITVTYDPAPGFMVRGNELLHDVFSNLVGNAIKHSAGPVHVSIRIRPVTEDDSEYYLVEVEDDGKGVPDELKKRIFERLSRGNTKAKGSGLGLYLVRTIVESHGGQVWVEDRVAGDYRQGSRFIVRLPAPGTGECTA